MKKQTKRKSVTTFKADPKDVKEALQLTWLLKGNLKNAQLAYLRVGKLLADIRDRNLFAALGHADMEDYAEQRVHLSRASLYRYLQVYDWVVKFHSAWLQPKPAGFIPDLGDVANLIWIENELAKTDLDAKKRAALEALKQKALDGQLRRKDLDPYRKKHEDKNALKAFLSKLRLLRMRGAQLVTMPPEVISHLDSAIEILINEKVVRAAKLHLIYGGKVFSDRRGNHLRKAL